jgi:hypothetical protein
MFAIPGIVALVVLIYARPQEFVPELQTVPILYVAFFLALFGMLLDWREGNTRLFATPQLPWVLLFYCWCVVTALMYSPRQVHVHAISLGIAIVLYLVIGHGIQTFRGLHVAGGAVLAMALFVAGVAVHQGFQSTGCVLVDETVVGETAGTTDGRSCVAEADCYLGNAEPGGEYLCERVGLFGTTSIGNGRVRYRGVLQDPNELSLAAAIGMPLVFAWGRRKYRPLSWVLALVVLAVVLACTILSASRGGIIVLLAVLGAYFLKRFGARGAAVGAALGAPLLVYGGRSGSEASASTTDRVDCWYEAISMWRSHPLTGVGFGQFGEYHYLTAHNSYLLTVAELGLPGLLLFSIVVYLSLKIPVVALRRYPSDSMSGVDLGIVRAWTMALAAAFAGLFVGIFFLSFAYHYVLWIYVGLSAALYGAIKRHDAEFDVTLGRSEFVMILAADGLFVVAMYFFTRLMIA